MKKIFIFTAVFILSFCVSSRAEEIALNLDEVVAIALRDNRDIQLKAQDVNKAKYKIAEAHASLFPSLTVTGNETYTKGYYDEDVAQFSSQVNIKQNLYQGGKIQGTIQQNEYLLTVAESLLDKTKLETVLSVKNTFFTLLLAKNFAELNKNILENTAQHLEYIKARYQNGQASESDVLSLESSLANVQKVYESSLNEIEASQSLLNTLLYLDTEVKIIPKGEFNYEPKDFVYDETLIKALEERPEIKQYRAQEKADEKAIQVAKANGRPNIYAAWDYYSCSHALSGTGAVENWNDHNVIGVVISWPIFDGWATKAKVEQAIVDLKETQLLKEQNVKDIALELKNAYLGLKDSLAKIQAADSDIKVYGDNFSTAQDRYNKGIASRLDLSDADVKFLTAKFNKDQAVYDYITAKNSYDKATGGI